MYYKEKPRQSGILSSLAGIGSTARVCSPRTRRRRLAANFAKLPGYESAIDQAVLLEPGVFLLSSSYFLSLASSS